MPIDENLRAQIETYLSHLDGLISRGCQLRDALTTDPSSASPIAATRAWQEDCGVTINQLSGGSKAHWLARSFSEAFLMRSEDGRAAEGAEPAEIVTRLIDVLEQAVATLSGMGDGASATESSPASLSASQSAYQSASKSAAQSAANEAPPPHRFDFVHNPELRPVVEQAYLDSRRALEQKDYDLALRTSCGILEAIVTDALAYKGLGALAAAEAPAGNIADWSFNTRLAVAEKAGLIRNGCARLPAVARTYRDHPDADAGGGSKATVSERDARQAGQVLNVVMRDLDPGR